MLYIPQKIKELIGNESYAADSVGMSDSSVLIFKDTVLKIQSICDESENELYMLGALGGRLPVPEIIESVKENGKQYILMSRIKGKMLCDGEYMNNPSLLLSLAAEAVKLLWSVKDVDSAGKISHLSSRLKAAEENVIGGLVDTDKAEPETFSPRGFKNPEQLLFWLKENAPGEDLSFTHGDLCLPNVFARGDEIVGFLDLGKAGKADKWQDIALCARSIKHNADGFYTGEKYFDFETADFLSEIGILNDAEKMRYYILLDELF